MILFYISLQKKEWGGTRRKNYSFWMVIFFGNDKEFSVPFRSLVTIQSLGVLSAHADIILLYILINKYTINLKIKNFKSNNNLYYFYESFSFLIFLNFYWFKNIIFEKQLWYFYFKIYCYLWPVLSYWFIKNCLNKLCNFLIFLLIFSLIYACIFSPIGSVECRQYKQTLADIAFSLFSLSNKK